VLEVKNGAVCLSEAHGGPSQQWAFEVDGTIRSRLGFVLDICEEKTRAGALVIPYQRHGGWNQIFRIVPI